MHPNRNSLAEILNDDVKTRVTVMPHKNRHGLNYVLIDGYGSKYLPSSMLDRLRTDGVEAVLRKQREEVKFGIDVLRNIEKPSAE